MIAATPQKLAGRITDRLGTRRVAAFGVVCATLIYVALSMMQGSFILFFLLNTAQIALSGATTGPGDMLCAIAGVALAAASAAAMRSEVEVLVIGWSPSEYAVHLGPGCFRRAEPR